jgi:hypothetical protein
VRPAHPSSRPSPNAARIRCQREHEHFANRRASISQASSHGWGPLALSLRPAFATPIEEAERAAHAATRALARNDSRPATILDAGAAAVQPAPSPTCGGPGLLAGNRPDSHRGPGQKQALQVCRARAGPRMLAALPGADQPNQNDHKQHPRPRIGREEATSRYNFRIIGICAKDTEDGEGCQLLGRPDTELSTTKRGSTLRLPWSPTKSHSWFC